MTSRSAAATGWTSRSCGRCSASPTTGTSRAFDTDISISRYIDGWGREGDTALIATEGGHRSAQAGTGSSRTRPGYGYVDERDARADDRRRADPAGAGIGAAAPDRAARAGQGRGLPGDLGLGAARAPATRRRYSRAGFEQSARGRRDARHAPGLYAAGATARARDERRVDRVLHRRLAVEDLGAGRLELRPRAVRALDRDDRVVGPVADRDRRERGSRRAPSPRRRG